MPRLKTQNYKRLPEEALWFDLLTGRFSGSYFKKASGEELTSLLQVAGRNLELIAGQKKASRVSEKEIVLLARAYQHGLAEAYHRLRVGELREPFFTPVNPKYFLSAQNKNPVLRKAFKVIAARKRVKKSVPRKRFLPKRRL